MRKSLHKNKPGAVIIEGHVQGLSNTRSLGEASIPVYVVDKTNSIARYSKYCRKYFRCPDFNTDEFAEFLINLAVSENITGWVLIPSNDHAVYTIAKYKTKLEKYYKVITPGLDIIEKIYDKSKLLEIAQNNNIPIPKTIYLQSEYDIKGKDINFPVLTKGKYGLTFYKAIGKKALFADNEIELRKQLKQIQDNYNVEYTFTQELIPLNGKNNTVSFTAFCIDGDIKTYWMGEKLREHPLRFGTATFARSVYIEECYKKSVPLLKALNYTGVCEVEYILDPRDNQYKLIEINPRTWLWVSLAKASGIDYAQYIYDYVNNIENDYPQYYKTNVYWSNFWTDLLYTTKEIFKNGTSYKELTSIFVSDTKQAVYSKDDIKPFIMMSVMLPYLTWKRI